MAMFADSAVAEKNPTRRRIFISGLDMIEHVGSGNLEFVFYVTEDEGAGPVRHRVAESIVMHRDQLPDAIGKALMALARQVLVRPDGSITVMH